MKKASEDYGNGNDFDSETLSLHSRHSFHEEEIPEYDSHPISNHKTNKSMIISQENKEEFRVTNAFKQIMKNLEGVQLPQQARKLRSISRDFRSNLDKYIDKNKTSLISNKKPTKTVYLQNIRKEFENNQKLLSVLKREYDEWSKVHFKRTQNQYKESLELERKSLEHKIEVTRKEISSMNLEKTKLGCRIEEYEKISRETLDLEDQISLQKKKAEELEQKIYGVEILKEKTAESMSVANENIRKIDELATYYKIKLERPSKDLENIYQTLAFKIRFLQNRIGKLREEAPMKSINLDIKSLKKKIKLLNHVLDLQTKEFNELVQTLLLQNRSLSNCIEDSIKIRFVAEQIKRMGLTHQTFYQRKSNKTNDEKNSGDSIEQNLLTMEKNAELFQGELEKQIQELRQITMGSPEKNEERLLNIESPEKFGVLKNESPEKYENFKKENIDSENDNALALNQKISIDQRNLPQNENLADFMKTQTINQKTTFESNIKEDFNSFKEETKFPQTLQDQTENNESNRLMGNQTQTETEKKSELEVPTSNSRPGGEGNEILWNKFPSQDIKPPDPPKRTFNFSRNRDYSNLFKDYETPKVVQDEHREIFDEVLIKEQPTTKPIPRVIKDPSLIDDPPKRPRLRKIMDPKPEEFASNIEKRKELKEERALKSTTKTTNRNIFDAEVNYFSEFNI